MVRRILSMISYFLFFCFFVFLTIFYKQPLFIFVLMLLIVFPPVSYFLCRYAFWHLIPSIQLRPLEGQAKSTATLQLKLSNETFFPLPDCTLEYTIDSAFYPCNQLRILNCPSYSKGTFSFDVPLYFEKSACYRIQISKLSAFDYLHFFEFKKELSISKEITILPKHVDTITFQAEAFGEGFDEFEETTAKGNVSSNVTDLREYIPGDRLQKIHWKLSARVQKLMVKENEQTSSNQFTLMVELYQPDPVSDCLEQALSNCLSMAEALLMAQEVFFFTFYATDRQDFVTFLIKNKEDLQAALSECFYQSTYPQKDLALETQRKAKLVKGILLYATYEGVTDVDLS